MAAAARESGRVTSVNYRYRWVPAARYLKELVETGEVGAIRQIFMNYFNALVQDASTPLQWRQTRAEGGGNLADIGSHLIDMGIWLLGPITRVRCDLRTFTPERPAGGNGMVPVDVDDAAMCQLEFASGAVGVLNASGVCLGRGQSPADRGLRHQGRASSTRSTPPTTSAAIASTSASAGRSTAPPAWPRP